MTDTETQLIKQLAADVEKFTTYKIITTIKRHYGTLEAYKAECAKRDNKALARYVENFHIEEKALQSLTRRNGKRYLKEVLKLFGGDNARLVYKRKFAWKYKSGKKFIKPSTWHIPFARLAELFKMEGSPLDPFQTKSGYYTREQHRLIDDLLLYPKERRAYGSGKAEEAELERRFQEVLAYLDAHPIPAEGRCNEWRITPPEAKIA